MIIHFLVFHILIKYFCSSKLLSFNSKQNYVMLYFKTKLVLVYLIVCGLIACTNNHNRKMISDTKNMPNTEANSDTEKNSTFLTDTIMSPETVKDVFNSSKVNIHRFPHVNFPSGRIAMGDPLFTMPDKRRISYLKDTIPSGKYTIEIAIAKTKHFGLRIAGMRLRLSDQEAIRYKLVEDYMPYAEEPENNLGGFDVEAGLATFCDANAVSAYEIFSDKWYGNDIKKNIYDEYFSTLFTESYKKYPSLQRKDGDFIRWSVPNSKEEIVMVTSGLGDDWYNVFWGYDTLGARCELVTIFISPELF